HVQLGWFYFEQDNYARAREVFARALRVNPRQDSAYVGLAYTARDLGRLSEARDFAVKAVELNPGNKHACAALSGVYARMGQYDAAMEYSQKVNNLDSTRFRPVTVNSYRLLKEKLDTRGIRLICVQYPMRSVAALMNIFENKTGVIFVDNEESFKQLVRDAGVKQVFRDLFAGDFGHCTDKGNRLLAQNIAEAILKAVGSAAR
ncbi:MAG: tetratricopeptide repeat protein, partial [Candidatus Omnitrophota bacterium]